MDNKSEDISATNNHRNKESLHSDESYEQSDEDDFEAPIKNTVSQAIFNKYQKNTNNLTEPVIHEEEEEDLTETQ